MKEKFSIWLYENRHVINRVRFWFVIILYICANYQFQNMPEYVHCLFLVFSAYNLKYLRKKN